MRFNFLIIPIVVAAVAYYGSRFTKQGLPWYRHLKKPRWTPGGELIGSIWTFLYITVAFGALWFWNIPAFSWYHYVVGAALLANAYLNATWTKIFFVEKDISQAYRRLRQLIIATMVVIAMMLPVSPIAVVFFLPYLAWLIIAAKLNQQIQRLNRT